MVAEVKGPVSYDDFARLDLRGVWSRGMLLAAQDGAGLSLVAPGPARTPGSAVR